MLKFLYLSLLLFTSSFCFAQLPVVKIDFDMAGRSSSQVSEPNYYAWNKYDISNQTIEGVTFSISKEGNNGTRLKSNWYKGGIKNSKLISDGVTVDHGNEGAGILISIKGLPKGEHSLLVFLNNVDSPDANTFSPVNIFVNDKLILENITPSVRALSKYSAQIVYFTFKAKKNKEVRVLFKSNTTNHNTTNKNIVINAIELNTPNLLDQAKKPYPENNNEHVVANNNEITLTWEKDDEAVSHNIFFSSDYKEILYANKSNNSYRGNQKDTTYKVNKLNSHLTYFWRVDEIKKDGTITKGNIWTFRTAQPAFPGAEGYGRYARGGRDGKVVHVTNLNDSGEGSLRYAIEEEKGPRTIIFDVAGLIELKSRLTLSDNKVTIAGQTAPGKGICIKNAPLGLSGAEDVIIQNIRVRRGSEGDYNWGLDGMGMQGSNNCIIDHCSISWTIDEAFSSRSGQNITLQRTLISEALNTAGHPNYPAGTKHGYAGSIGGDVGSFHHNLLAHCEGRNWSLAGGLDGDAYYAGRLDIRNNVVYNWGHRATDGGSKEVNFVGNYYKPGAATDQFYALIIDHEGTGLGTQRGYFMGNVMPGYFDESNQHEGRIYRIRNKAIVEWETFVEKPFFESYVNTQTAVAAYKDVLSDVGCIFPETDDHDQRIIKETLTGTYSCKGSKSGKPGLPDDQEDVGGYENYPYETRSTDWDTDGDGLPDWWEKFFNLNIQSDKNDFSDSNNDEDNNGYTQLEEYLQWMNKPHYINKIGDDINFSLLSLFKGYEKSPKYSIEKETNGTIIIKDDQAIITSRKEGFASFVVKVVDADGDSKKREIVAFFK
ncbi:pectate lyase family protein [Plebeiibacterium sediminum]|uniref:Pectate lyase n=1 Tax=Plebeiibacterium sediminum TaxID=2992112 RepID=A0AAE3SEF0_9BACT|nr:hypothetical protein [Plebeiobacterium sediminum]MCW3785957.1 hypothetical protein [Plebeiobacterium sediminum]